VTQTTRPYQKNVPVILIAEKASGRLDSLRGLVRELYFLSPFDSTFKELVLAFSVRKNTVWIWLVLRSATEQTLRLIGERAKKAEIGWIDLSRQSEEERERHRETVVKDQESYQVFAAEDIDGLLALFIKRLEMEQTG